MGSSLTASRGSHTLCSRVSSSTAPPASAQGPAPHRNLKETLFAMERGLAGLPAWLPGGTKGRHARGGATRPAGTRGPEVPPPRLPAGAAGTSGWAAWRRRRRQGRLPGEVGAAKLARGRGAGRRPGERARPPRRPRPGPGGIKGASSLPPAGAAARPSAGLGGRYGAPLPRAADGSPAPLRAPPGQPARRSFFESSGNNVMLDVLD